MGRRKREKNKKIIIIKKIKTLKIIYKQKVIGKMIREQGQVKQKQAKIGTVHATVSAHLTDSKMSNIYYMV